MVDVACHEVSIDHLKCLFSASVRLFIVKDNQGLMVVRCYIKLVITGAQIVNDLQ